MAARSRPAQTSICTAGTEEREHGARCKKDQGRHRHDHQEQRARVAQEARSQRREVPRQPRVDWEAHSAHHRDDGFGGLHRHIKGDPVQAERFDAEQLAHQEIIGVLVDVIEHARAGHVQPKTHEAFGLREREVQLRAKRGQRPQ